MTDNVAASGLVTAAVVALQEGERVLIRFDGEPAWVEVSTINLSQWGSGAIEFCRTEDGRTVLIPASRLLAVDVGELKA
jgi:hypothetical protein